MCSLFYVLVYALFLYDQGDSDSNKYPYYKHGILWS